MKKKRGVDETLVKQKPNSRRKTNGTFMYRLLDIVKGTFSGQSLRRAWVCMLSVGVCVCELVAVFLLGPPPISAPPTPHTNYHPFCATTFTEFT